MNFVNNFIINFIAIDLNFFCIKKKKTNKDIQSYFFESFILFLFCFRKKFKFFLKQYL